LAPKPKGSVFLSITTGKENSLSAKTNSSGKFNVNMISRKFELQCFSKSNSNAKIIVACIWLTIDIDIFLCCIKVYAIN
jgi:hypothetical protein